MTGYELSRNWFDYCFNNPHKIKPIHSAIYFFAIEHCNRLGWKDSFGFPSQMVMEAVGVKNWRTYSKALNDIVEFGFIEMLEVSKNQYSSNIIAIVKNTKATTKALDKALQKHSTKQGQSTVSINKQYNNKQLTVYTEQQFLKRWKDARLHFDKQPTNISKLLPHELRNFENIKRLYTSKQIEQAIQGLFQQKTYKSTRLRPTHFLELEHFEKYLTCYQTKEKLFEDKKYIKPKERI